MVQLGGGAVTFTVIEVEQRFLGEYPVHLPLTIMRVDPSVRPVILTLLPGSAEVLTTPAGVWLNLYSGEKLVEGERVTGRSLDWPTVRLMLAREIEQ